jgi:hypothetical protein
MSDGVDPDDDDEDCDHNNNRAGAKHPPSFFRSLPKNVKHFLIGSSWLLFG